MQIHEVETHNVKKKLAVITCESTLNSPQYIQPIYPISQTFWDNLKKNLSSRVRSPWPSSSKAEHGEEHQNSERLNWAQRYEDAYLHLL